MVDWDALPSDLKAIVVDRLGETWNGRKEQQNLALVSKAWWSIAERLFWRRLDFLPDDAAPRRGQQVRYMRRSTTLYNALLRAPHRIEALTTLWLYVTPPAQRLIFHDLLKQAADRLTELRQYNHEGWYDEDDRRKTTYRPSTALKELFLSSIDLPNLTSLDRLEIGLIDESPPAYFSGLKSLLGKTPNLKSLSVHLLEKEGGVPAQILSAEENLQWPILPELKTLKIDINRYTLALLPALKHFRPEELVLTLCDPYLCEMTSIGVDVIPTLKNMENVTVVGKATVMYEVVIKVIRDLTAFQSTKYLYICESFDRAGETGGAIWLAVQGGLFPNLETLEFDFRPGDQWRQISAWPKMLPLLPQLRNIRVNDLQTYLSEDVVIQSYHSIDHDLRVVWFRWYVEGFWQPSRAFTIVHLDGKRLNMNLRSFLSDILGPDDAIVRMVPYEGPTPEVPDFTRDSQPPGAPRLTLPPAVWSALEKVAQSQWSSGLAVGLERV